MAKRSRSTKPPKSPGRVGQPAVVPESVPPELISARLPQPQQIRRVLRTDLDGLLPLMNALPDRQFDLYDVSSAEWQAMSSRQRGELIKHQNNSIHTDHNFGPSYFTSQTLCDAVDRAHALYVKMSPEQRRSVVHPRHLDQWLDDRRIVTIVARDLDLDEPTPEYLQPQSYRIPDEGVQPVRATRLNLTIAVSLDAPLESVVDAVRDLINGLHGPAARRPRRAGAVRRDREKYDDDEIAKMIDWYYRHGAGEPLKQLAIAAAGPTAEHVRAAQSKILR